MSDADNFNDTYDEITNLVGTIPDPDLQVALTEKLEWLKMYFELAKIAMDELSSENLDLNMKSQKCFSTRISGEQNDGLQKGDVNLCDLIM